MKKLLFLAFCTALSFNIFSQGFEVPKDYVFEKPEDYKAYEEKIIQCIDWLIETPANQEFQKRMEANSFLLRWATGSPDVTIEIRQEVVTFLQTSPELLMIFIGGWTKHQLMNKKNKSILDSSLASLETVIQYYEKNKEHLNKDENVEIFIDLKKKGKLKDHLKGVL